MCKLFITHDIYLGFSREKNAHCVSHNSQYGDCLSQPERIDCGYHDFLSRPARVISYHWREWKLQCRRLHQQVLVISQRSPSTASLTTRNVPPTPGCLGSSEQCDQPWQREVLDQQPGSQTDITDDNITCHLHHLIPLAIDTIEQFRIRLPINITMTDRIFNLNKYNNRLVEQLTVSLQLSACHSMFPTVQQRKQLMPIYSRELRIPAPYRQSSLLVCMFLHINTLLAFNYQLLCLMKPDESNWNWSKITAL